MNSQQTSLQFSDDPMKKAWVWLQTESKNHLAQFETVPLFRFFQHFFWQSYAPNIKYHQTSSITSPDSKMNRSFIPKEAFTILGKGYFSRFWESHRKIWVAETTHLNGMASTHLNTSQSDFFSECDLFVGKKTWITIPTSSPNSGWTFSRGFVGTHVIPVDPGSFHVKMAMGLGYTPENHPLPCFKASIVMLVSFVSSNQQ